jgi:hypothetical protein
MPNLKGFRESDLLERASNFFSWKYKLHMFMEKMHICIIAHGKAKTPTNPQ